MSWEDDPVQYIANPNGGPALAVWGTGGKFAPGTYQYVQGGGGPGYTDPNGYGWVPVGGTGSSAVNVSTATGVNPTETAYSLYGHIIPLSVFGIGRIGGEIIAGPWIANGKATFCISFGVPADPSGTRTLKEIAFDSEVVWTASGGFAVEAFTYRFYGGTLSQAADPIEIAQFGANAVAYRPQILIWFENLPLANTKFGKIPYVAAVIQDSSGTDVNLGEAFERLAYSPWVGYTSAEFDTTDITDGLVDGGLIITADTDFLSLIQQFGRFYRNWDILQTDKLRIVDRGATTTADLGLNRSRLIGDVSYMRDEPNSVPRVLELSTIDPAQDYTIVPSRTNRPRDPVNVSASVATESVYLPAIMDSSTRMSLVTYAQYAEEVSRKKIHYTATMYGLEIEPGDLITISGLPTGFHDETFKVLETLHGANYTIEVTAEAFMNCDFSWNVIYSATGAGNTFTNGPANLRGYFPASLFTGVANGTRMRVTFQSQVGGQLDVRSASIGHANTSVNNWNFDGTQVALTFGGNAGFYIIDDIIVSDPVSYAFDHTKPLVVSLFCWSNLTNRYMNVTGAIGYVHVTVTDETMTSVVTGYTGSVNTIHATIKIEVLP